MGNVNPTQPKGSPWSHCHDIKRILYVHLTQCAELLSKHDKANFRHLLGMELKTDAIFLVLSSVNNDLFTYVLATGVGCEIRYVGTIELKNVPYISARVTCTINFSVIETWML